ncbi:solute carrier family 35 member C2 isoform X1 [Tachyglossus aculeatus]|uniref:solute carrier family 35 member C2 isoform X1 n=1 Tax=Tachyglossus aculeatus TaxID=9261 RepID=UPI0018F7680B|nr:solute carrier family 35 member C2 isoform X1 [Tachyglossus aculeatus]
MAKRGSVPAFLGRALLTLGLVLFYYCFSIGITFYNKWLMKSFHFPLFMTLLHLAVIFASSALARAALGCLHARARVVLSWPVYLRRVAPTALATVLDVGLSNWSFLYITVSLYTMTKSSAVLFILMFSLIFRLEELRAGLVLVVVLVAGGLFLFTYKSTQFDAEGFALVLAASFVGGVRWTLTQMLLQKAELGLQNPIDTMFHLQPLMFLGLFPLFAAVEGLPLSTSRKLFRAEGAGALAGVLGALLGGGLLAFGLGFSEFLLVSRTSSLTLSIAGIFKCARCCWRPTGWGTRSTSSTGWASPSAWRGSPCTSPSRPSPPKVPRAPGGRPKEPAPTRTWSCGCCGGPGARTTRTTTTTTTTTTRATGPPAAPDPPGAEGREC